MVNRKIDLGGSGKFIRSKLSYFKFRKKYPFVFYDRHRRIYVTDKKTKQEFTKKKRIRKQVVLNDLYSVSARAIIINGNVTHQQLRKALGDTLEREGYINLLASPHLNIGNEEEEIDSDEDKNLKDGIIYIEINQRGVVTLYNL